MVKTKEAQPSAADNKIETRINGSMDLLTVNVNKRTFVPVQGGVKLYEFPNGRQLEVYNSKYLNTDEGGHRIICEDGTCFFIRPSESWFITWRNYTMLDENYRF